MKRLLPYLAATLAVGLFPSAASPLAAQTRQATSVQAQSGPSQPAQAQPAAAQPAPGLPAPPTDAIGAASQAQGGAQPQESSDPAIANITGEEPPAAQVAQASAAARSTPIVGVGQPDGRMDFQDQVTPIGQEALWFHNAILLPLIAAISLFVLALMLWAVVRFRRSAHPVPSRTTHHVGLEIAWTLIPVVILVAIAVPSIKLLANQYSPPAADITIKAIGNQWYWTYQYPDNGDFEIISNILSDDDAKTRGEPRQLAVDERMVVPAGATVKLIVTSADVIHSWGVPAFWTKMDAVPGRLNETWFKVDRPGVYYGVCYELCGARHGYMPIAVDVLPRDQFAAWVAAKGGTMPGQVAPTSSDATQNSPIANPTGVATGGSGATETTPDIGEDRIVNVTTTAPVSEQGATNSRRGGTN